MFLAVFNKNLVFDYLTFPNIFSLLLICSGTEPNTLGLIVLHAHDAKQQDFARVIVFVDTLIDYRYSGDASLVLFLDI